MRRKKEIEIVFDGNDPLILYESNTELLLKETKKELYKYKRITHVKYIIEDFIFGLSFCFILLFIIILVT